MLMGKMNLKHFNLVVPDGKNAFVSVYIRCLLSNSCHSGHLLSYFINVTANFYLDILQ